MSRKSGAVVSAGRTQASRVSASWRSRLAAGGTLTRSSTPSKAKPCCTTPASKVVPFSGKPGLLSAASPASPSPGHQLTRPDGGWTHTSPCPKAWAETSSRQPERIRNVALDIAGLASMVSSFSQDRSARAASSPGGRQVERANKEWDVDPFLPVARLQTLHELVFQEIGRLQVARPQDDVELHGEIAEAQEAHDRPGIRDASLDGVHDVP